MSGPANIAQLSLSQIRELFRCGQGFNRAMLEQLDHDPRCGARRLGHSLRRMKAGSLRDQTRLQELVAIEAHLRRTGVRTVAGLDEVGRGPLAGPVVSAVVIPPWPCRWSGLDDSKRLAPKKREDFTRRIFEESMAVGVGIVSAEQIDRFGILEATWESMRKALADIRERPGHLLVDGPMIIPKVSIPQTALVGGDARALCIAAASVVAKVTRDRIMDRLHAQHPQYGFERHKGYGTLEHRAALERHGPCPAHRRTFRGVLKNRA